MPQNNSELILRAARATVSIERDALSALEKSIGQAFAEAVEAVFSTKGRLVVTGVGKSAIVAQKIAATLNSTGQPALFMHAADALHGDLGMVQPEDFVLILSKSGETAEIKALVPLVKNLGNKIIGIAASPAGFLAKQADHFLEIPIEKEADPNNLAPTASSTSMVALGDAMAVALLALRGFSPEDFSKFHPGGSLGKQLYLRVADLFILNEKPAVAPDAPLREVIFEISSKRLGATAVVSKTGKLEGIITDGDLRRMLEKGVGFERVAAADILSANPKTVSPETLAVDALSLMRARSITQLLVVDEKGAYIGVLHLHDLLREGLI